MEGMRQKLSPSQSTLRVLMSASLAVQACTAGVQTRNFGINYPGTIQALNLGPPEEFGQREGWQTKWFKYVSQETSEV